MKTRDGWGGLARTSRDSPQEPHLWPLPVHWQRPVLLYESDMVRNEIMRLRTANANRAPGPSRSRTADAARVAIPLLIAFAARRWCTNRNWHATVPTTGASSTDGVGSWAAHIGHRIQHIARELRFDRSPTGCPGSKTIAADRRIPEEGVLDSRVLLVA